MMNVVALLIVIGFTVFGCATVPKEPPPGTPKVERLHRPPAGSTWVRAYTNSGSFGNGSGRSTIRSEGERDFQGGKYWAYSIDGVDVSYYDAAGRFVGRTVNGAVREINDPGFQSYAWPLYVGRSWDQSFRFTDSAVGRTFDNVRFQSTIEAYEDVTTPAGTFKAFRIVHDNSSLRMTNWWSPDSGIVVKSKSERKANYYSGAGMRETEVMSLDLKK